MHRSGLSLQHRLCQICAHNRDVSLLKVFSNLGGLGILYDPGVTLRKWFKHLKEDSKHLRRWTMVDRPEAPEVVFGRTIAKMEMLRLLDEYVGPHQFSIDAYTRQGPVRIIGEIMDGELRPQSLFFEGQPIDRKRGPLIDLTKIIDDPNQYWDPKTNPVEVLKTTLLFARS